MGKIVKILIILVALFGATLSLDQAVEDKVDFIKNFVSSKDQDLTIISDSALAPAAMTSLQRSEIPLSFFSLESLEHRVMDLKRLKCPVLTSYADVQREVEGVFVPELALPITNYPKALVFWTKDINRAVSILIQSLFECPQKIDMGLLNHQWQLIFFVESQVQVQQILRNDLLSNHPMLLAVQTGNNIGHQRFLVTAPNFATALRSDSKRFIASSPMNDGAKWMAKNVLRMPTNLGGQVLRVGAIIIGYQPGDIIKRNKHSEYDLYMLQALEKALNFQAIIEVPHKLQFGTYNESGHHDGITAMVAYDQVDFVLMGIVQNFNYEQIGDTLITTVPPLFATVVVPQPNPNSKVLALFRPFSLLLWLILATTFFIVALVLSFSADSKTKKSSKSSKFIKLRKSLWFCYGTLMGEIVARDMIHRRNVFRSLVVLWLLSCFLITAGYAGNLKSFLSNPGEQSPLENVEEILESQLEIHWMNYGQDHRLRVLGLDENIQELYGRREEKSVFKMPLVQMLEPVRRKEAVLVGASTVLDETIQLAFTAPSGKKLIRPTNIDLQIVEYSRLCWLFNMRGPWFQLFRKLSRQMFDTGVMPTFYSRLVRDRRREHLMNNVLPVVAEKGVVVFSLDDLQAIFILYGAVMGLALITFFMEKGVRMKQQFYAKFCQFVRHFGQRI